MMQKFDLIIIGGGAGAFAGGILYYSNYVVRDQTIGYVGAAVLIAAVVADYIIRRRYKAYCEDCIVKPKK